MEYYNQHFVIPSCITISVWTINFVLGNINLERRSATRSPDSDVPKRVLWFRAPVLGLFYDEIIPPDTGILSWPKREFCRPHFYILGSFAKFRKMTVGFDMSVRLQGTTRFPKVGAGHEIRCLNPFRHLSKKCFIKNMTRIKGRPAHVYNISPNSCNEECFRQKL
jgi:hypothetical protein